MFIILTFSLIGIFLVSLSIWLAKRQKKQEPVDYVFRDPADEERIPGCRDDDSTRVHAAYQRITKYRDEETE